MIATIDCDIERRAIDLEIDYQKAVNQILNYLQRGHVWDTELGWDGEENRLPIHENNVTKICTILWHNGQIVAYSTGNIIQFCSRTQWAQWVATDPGQNNRRLQFKQFTEQALGSR